MDVLCRKLKSRLPRLKNAPIPNEVGKLIYDNISAKAWELWLEYQTKYINENKLNLRHSSDRAKLNEQMLDFLNIATLCK
jgi:Fe-S cluster biosynthesis and repair protein YggX